MDEAVLENSLNPVLKSLFHLFRYLKMKDGIVLDDGSDNNGLGQV